MILKNRLSLFVLLLAMVGLQNSYAAGEAKGKLPFDPSQPIVTRLADGVYQYFHQFYNSLIIIGDNGVIVTDPSGEARAKVLRQEIRKLTDKPVRKVIYSHDHFDHTRGGQLFKDEGAEFVSHANAVELIARDPYKSAVKPDLTYTDSMRLVQGGKTVDLIYMGPNDGNAMSVIYLPEQKILFAVDFHLPRYVNEPYRLVAHNYGGILHTMERIRKELEYDIVVAGHSPLSSPELFEEDYQFVKALYEQTLAGLKQGKSVDELKTSVKLPDFSHWHKYDENLPAHVERMAYTIWHGN
ncbi:MBL fold metallo-hydrolase [Endozoicomonadaceae bacterium StTr2]